MNFTHLHVHTQYSLLDGAARIKDLVKRAKELGMTSLAITDHGVMYGVIAFYRACKDAGIKPIIGCEVYVAPGSRFDREASKDDDRYYHLVLLAENEIGYQNLSKIVSLGYIDGFYYKPRVDMELLREHHEGIIALSACLAGELAVKLRRNDYEGAKEVALRYQDIFGKDNYFLEMQDHGISEQVTVNTGVMRLSEELGIPMVVTNDSHYVRAEDAEAHDILLCIQTGKKLNDETRLRYDGGQYYLKSAEEMEQLFPYAKEALENTNKIAERCNVEIKFGEQKVPEYDVPDGYTSYEYLRKLCEDGLKRKYKEVTKEVWDRYEFEINTINNMGFVDYFLIVWDYINYAKKQGIAVGPGRGSAAGSVVAYSLDITQVEPIQYDLFFERFLNPERITMPDIDVDFQDNRRQEVIDYVCEKYGREKVVQIVTYGTIGAKTAVRDVGRVMDLPFSLCSDVAKMIPAPSTEHKNMTLALAMELNKELKDLYDSNPDVKTLIDFGMQLEGLPRQIGMHASGVVIGRVPIIEYVPLATSGDGVVITQYDKDEIESLGLLKMDFLGNRNLTVVQDAVNLIKETRGIDIDVDTISYDDKAVYEMLSAGKTDGVFQLESNGMKSFMKELKPGNNEDVVAGISLYRPGPMDFIPDYIRGKNNRDTITYDTPELEEILEPTYGCIVYQEQVMKIFMKLAGYSLGRSDKVRKAMGKKQMEIIQAEKEIFLHGDEAAGIPGCAKNGIDEEVAKKIFAEMQEFAKYAFNKSHAACYAVVCFQTAYLKCHYPAEYMAALISSVNSSTKVSKYIQDCRSMGIKILPPDVNSGKGNFSVDNGNIRYGLSSIKSVGDGVTNMIKQDLDLNGPFSDLEEFATRLTHKEANKRTIESFILAGAFDGFGHTRRQMIYAYPQILDNVSRQRKTNVTGQLSLFDMDNTAEEDKNKIKVQYPDVGEYDKDYLYSKEKEMLGVYVSGHPLEEYVEFIEQETDASSLDFMKEESENDEMELEQEAGSGYKVYDKVKYTVGGIIEEVTIKMTRKGANMAFVTLEDLYGTIEIVVFPKDYEKYRHLLVKENKIFVTGNASVDEREAKLLCSEIVTFEEAVEEKEATSKLLYLRFTDKEVYDALERNMLTKLKQYPGKTPVVVLLQLTQDDGTKQMRMKNLEKSFAISISDELISDLKAMLGDDNVAIGENKKH